LECSEVIKYQILQLNLRDLNLSQAGFKSGRRLLSSFAPMYNVGSEEISASPRGRGIAVQGTSFEGS